MFLITGTNFFSVLRKLKEILSPINVVHFEKLWSNESSKESNGLIFVLLSGMYSTETIDGIIHQIKLNSNKERDFLVSIIIKVMYIK